MCGTCGCGEDDHITYRKPGQPHMTHTHHHGHEHHHDHDHHDHDYHHDHSHAHTHTPQSRVVEIQRNILSKNDLTAERNRGYFEALQIKALNLVSSPGSGKTTILERTITEKRTSWDIAVIEGDQQSMLDANRIEQAGAAVIQINTGQGCHLDALMVNHAMKQLELIPKTTLFIENVGNLVCPALFDLGETRRVLIVSVTEGEDKPVKYPHMFETSHLCLINKTDLLPYLDFDMDKFMDFAGKVNPQLEFLLVSAKTGEGLEAWYEWVEKIS